MMSREIEGREVVRNPDWLRWRNQVNANHHDGGMSPAHAQRVAGKEPPEWVEIDGDAVRYAGDGDAVRVVE